MFEDYFYENEIKPEYQKEFVSIWDGWLGKENYYKLDKVTEKEWGKFNNLIRIISKKYKMLIVDFNNKTFNEIIDIEETLSNYKESMNKSSKEFSYYFIPKLDCIISEHWNYTYIIWYKKNIMVELNEFIKKVELYHFK